MAGTPVDRNLLDAKASDAVVSVREAFRKVATLQAFLANNPNPSGQPDPLTTKYDYTEDEAYLIRLVIGDLNALNVSPILETGRKLTGLE